VAIGSTFGRGDVFGRSNEAHEASIDEFTMNADAPNTSLERTREG
jgi:hypothetical protein